MVDTVVDVGLIQRTGEAIGLSHVSSLRREEQRRTHIRKVTIARAAIHSQQVHQPFFSQPTIAKMSVQPLYSQRTESSSEQVPVEFLLPVLFASAYDSAS